LRTKLVSYYFLLIDSTLTDFEGVYLQPFPKASLLRSSTNYLYSNMKIIYSAMHDSAQAIICALLN